MSIFDTIQKILSIIKKHGFNPVDALNNSLIDFSQLTDRYKINDKDGGIIAMIEFYCRRSAELEVVLSYYNDSDLATMKTLAEEISSVLGTEIKPKKIRFQAVIYA